MQSKEMAVQGTSSSPNWNRTTKIIVILVILVVVAALLVRFSSLITPIVIALLLASLLHPLAEFLKYKLRFPWSVSVSIIYVLAFLIILGLLAVGGFALLEQVQGLVNFLQRAIVGLPDFLRQLTSQKFVLGPFLIDLTGFDWTTLGNQIISFIQPALARVGDVIGSLAGGAFQIVGSIFLAMILSYLLVSETGGERNRIFIIDIPGYQQDIMRLGQEVKTIWNAFLRGQAIVFLIRTMLYILLLGTLQVRFFIGLALAAGLANFIPYVGVAIAWIAYFLVSFFQGTTILGLDSFTYALLVTGSAWLMDNVYDTVITPRIIGGALRLHPAVIMVGALIGLNLFGVMGMILAAPVLASIKLGFQYVQQKLQDKDPWQSIESEYLKPQHYPILGRLYRTAKQKLDDSEVLHHTQGNRSGKKGKSRKKEK